MYFLLDPAANLRLVRKKKRAFARRIQQMEEQISKGSPSEGRERKASIGT
jgi:hypothetical protein